MTPRLVCLVGPTASGKTTLALELAEAIDGEIVSADSRLVYRGLDIGTAKPPPAERARVPHHALDLVDPEEAFDVARWSAIARRAIADVHGRGRAALVVGGTGLYIRTLLYGLCPAPPRVPRVRALLQRWAQQDGVPALHRRLGLIDPAAAARIHPHDAIRIVRALEVALVTGRRLSDRQRAHGFVAPIVDALVVGLAVTPATIDFRIAARIDAMLEAGWLDEVRMLAARGLPPEAPGWRTLGYGAMRDVVEGRAPLEAARAATVLATRRYAKRQRTWFRREANVVWRDPDAERGSIVAEACAFVRGDIANRGAAE